MSYPQIVLRVFIAAIAIWVFTRVAGKRQFAKLTFMEYILGLVPVSIAGAMTVSAQTDPLKGAFALVVWAMLSYVLHRLELRFQKFRKVLSEEPTLVIQNGQILPERLAQIRFSIHNLLVLLHEQGVFDIAEVEFAVVEPTGQLSILKKSQHQPVTPKDLKIPTAYKGLSLQLILDGKPNKAALKSAGLTEDWLQAQLEKQRIDDIKDVFLASLATDGSLYLAKRGPTRK